jgi:hypothetical protein
LLLKRNFDGLPNWIPAILVDFKCERGVPGRGLSLILP